MDATERAEVLKQISAIQQDTSSVTVQIGGVDASNQVESTTLYIKECPPRIISELEGMGYHLSVGEDGVRVW